MSNVKDRLTDYHDLMKKLTDYHQMILASDVLDMVEQLIDDFEEEKTDIEKRYWNSDKRKIYDYIQTEINPYGKPFEGTTYELGVKIMDYIKNMSDESGWIPVSERLPDPDKYILVSFENFSVPMIGRYTVDDEDSGTFRVGDEIDSFIDNDLFVNAWMPLPKPYKED